MQQMCEMFNLNYRQQQGNENTNEEKFDAKEFQRTEEKKAEKSKKLPN